MDAKIDAISYLFKKGEHARNCRIYHRKHGSGHRKYMKCRYKRHAKSMPEKGMPKVCKMMPKWNQNETKIQKYEPIL